MKNAFNGSTSAGIENLDTFRPFSPIVGKRCVYEDVCCWSSQAPLRANYPGDSNGDLLYSWLQITSGDRLLASLDPRLFQLFETLVAAGADWLVFEIVEGIGGGLVKEESNDDLAFARVLARQDREPRRTPDRIAVSAQSSPLEGDEQVSWAAHYVVERLENAVDMMNVSIDRMHRLVTNGDALKDLSIKQSYVTFSLLDGEEATLVATEDRSTGQLAVRDLHVALGRWLGEVTERRRSL